MWSRLLAVCDDLRSLGYAFALVLGFRYARRQTS